METGKMQTSKVASNRKHILHEKLQEHEVERMWRVISGKQGKLAFATYTVELFCHRVVKRIKVRSPQEDSVKNGASERKGVVGGWRCFKVSKRRIFTPMHTCKHRVRHSGIAIILRACRESRHMSGKKIFP